MHLFWTDRDLEKVTVCHQTQRIVSLLHQKLNNQENARTQVKSHITDYVMRFVHIITGMLSHSSQHYYSG